MPKQGEHGISWTDETWNPIRGCSRVSAGCQRCYAERVAARFSGVGQPYHGIARMVATAHDESTGEILRTVPQWTGDVSFIPSKLRVPLKWERPRRVFVNSMSDLFHEAVPHEWVDQIFAVMALCPQHTFQILTKRHHRMQDYVNLQKRITEAVDPIDNPVSRHMQNIISGERGRSARRRWGVPLSWPLPNVWLGVSVEDQKTADERIPALMQSSAAIRWVSYEPALGPIDFYRGGFSLLEYMVSPTGTVHEGIDWLVCGGESGPGARPMQLSWARSARDQCIESGVAYHFKQWGEWAPAANHVDSGHGNGMMKIGKRKAGRLLDGREWNEFPEVRK